MSAQFYVNALGEPAILSAEGGSEIRLWSAAFSLYKPENGGSFGLLVRRRLTDYSSLQANYTWNSNDLTLSANSTCLQGDTLYQGARNGSK